jgi:hypothetical protein
MGPLGHSRAAGEEHMDRTLEMCSSGPPPTRVRKQSCSTNLRMWKHKYTTRDFLWHPNGGPYGQIGTLGTFCNRAGGRVRDTMGTLGHSGETFGGRGASASYIGHVFPWATADMCVEAELLNQSANVETLMHNKSANVLHLNTGPPLTSEWGPLRAKWTTWDLL